MNYLRIFATTVFFFLLLSQNIELKGQDSQIIKINLTNGEFSDDTFLLFLNSGSLGSDIYDGLKLDNLGNTYAELFSQDSTERNLSINTLPDYLDEELTLPIYIRSTIADTFKIKITSFQNIQANWDISLVKPDSSDTVSVQLNTEYEFIHSGTFVSGVLSLQQFELIINPGIASNKASFLGTSGKNGWRFIGSTHTNTSYSAFLDTVWTQGALGSDNPSGAPNIFGWDEASQEFEAITNLDSTISSGIGFLAYLYEDDNPSTPNIDGGWPKNFQSEGISGFGTIDIPVSYTSGSDTTLNGFNLIANPYPFPIDWNAPSGWTKTNIKDALWIWDPNANSGDGDYLEHVSGIGASIDKIAPNQAFWVQADSLDPVLSISEDVEASDATLLKSRPDNKSFIGLKLETNGYSDDVYLAFSDTETSLFEIEKLNSLTKQTVSIYFLGDNEKKLAIASEPFDNLEEKRIPIHIETETETDQTLYFEPTKNSIIPVNWTILLEELPSRKVFDLSIDKDIPVDTTQAYFLRFEKSSLVSSEEGVGIPIEIQLQQNYPNPFNPSTNIDFTLPNYSFVRLEVHDLLGRKVAELLNEFKAAGNYTLNFDASALSTGIYIYQLSIGNTTINKKMMLIK